MKKFKKLLLSIIVAFLCVSTVNAATGSMSAVANTQVAVVGSTFTVTVTVRASEALGTWGFGISYDSSCVAYQGGSQLVTADYGNGTDVVRTYKYTFKALKSCTTSIKIINTGMYVWSDVKNAVPISVSNATVTIKTQAEIQASYSKDNYLKSLSVEGYEISPAFDKDTLEYSVSVPETVEQIKVNALVNDTRSRVTGAGTIDISEGANKIEIVVTAQNGGVKTYTLNVDVRDLNPIAVVVDGKDYTVVKKDTLLTEPTGFSKTTIKIGDDDIPAFKSEQAGLTVVGLKDSSGNIGMFLYDEDNKSYSRYDELRSTSFTLMPIEIASVPKGFKKDALSINGREYEVMKSEATDDFYIIYAMNVETGEKDYYQYDKDSGACIKYNAMAYESLIKQNEEFMLYVIVLGGATAVFVLLCIVLGARVSKLKKLLRKVARPKTMETHEVKKEEKADSFEEMTEDSASEESTSEKMNVSDEKSKAAETRDDGPDEDFLELDKRSKKKRRKNR